ncbi:MAG: GntR family transcriptional regulator, partial [Pseudolysinimonas sp.]
ILYKKRGIGMFVAEGARARLVAQRRNQFSQQFLAPLLTEAAKLGISSSDVVAMIQKGLS